MTSVKVLFTLGALLLVTTWAVSSTDTHAYEAEMAALETDEWSPHHGKQAEGEALIQAKEGTLNDAAPSPEETRFDADADENNPTSLFPGPTYGLPGYKESHDWLKDLDWWSPLVFDWRYYKARCADGCHEGEALKDMNEGQVKKYWLESGMDKRDVASATFGCEYYVKNNKELEEDLVDEEGYVKCKDAVKHFLTKGVFDGLSGSTYDGKVFSYDDKSYWKVKEHGCLAGCEPGTIKWDKNYAWTFWYMRTARGTSDKGYTNAAFLPVFAVRPGEETTGRSWGWWGGYPYFMTWYGRMMFCGATERWYCHWPIGEEHNGIKGGWRFNWWSRWRLPPMNWWRFYGLMVDETGYTLYEFSDPPIDNHDLDNRKPGPMGAHGFSRKVATKSKASWWGYDIHKVYHRADNVWTANSHRWGAEALPETCQKAAGGKCNIHCWDHSVRSWHQRWQIQKDCRAKGDVEKCGYCCKAKDTKDSDGNTVAGPIIRASAHCNTNSAHDSEYDGGAGKGKLFHCTCDKNWDEIEGIKMRTITDPNWERVWTGWTVADWMCSQHAYEQQGGCWWRMQTGRTAPYWIMDLTYYRLGDHVFNEAEMKALYMKGRSIEPLSSVEDNAEEKPSNRY